MTEKKKLTIADKIAHLKSFLSALKKLQKIVTQKKFFSEEMTQKCIERYLQLSLENVLDIADQIINEEEFKKPREYKENILILGEHGILPKNFAKRFSKAAGFRNILVHAYIKLDPRKVYLHFKYDIKDIEIFIHHILKFLKEN